MLRPSVPSTATGGTLMTAALPLLLRPHPHVTTASAESLDFQARVGHPTAPDPADRKSVV